MNYSKDFNTKKTDQLSPIPGKNQVQNNACGYVFKIEDMEKVRRFLILGTEGGTYYVKEKELTLNNAKTIVEMIKSGKGKEIVDLTIEVSDGGLARKNDAAIFVMALVISFGDLEAKRYVVDNITKVIRIGTHLFQFAQCVKSLRGWGNLVKKAINKWYLDKSVSELAFQVTKYSSRTTEEGNTKSKWSHRDLLRLNHIVPDSNERNILFNYIVKGIWKDDVKNDSLKIIEGFEKAMSCTNEKEIVKLIVDYKLTSEMIPTQFKNKKEVQEVLIANAGIINLIRNLGAYTASGLLDAYNTKTINFIVDKIINEEIIKNSRIHPLQILDALKVYDTGHGFKGTLTWNPVRKITDALNSAFYLTFKYIEPTNKKIVLAIDVSGSMGNKISGSNVLTCMEVSAVIAMVTAKVEKNYIMKAFSETMIPFDVSPNMSFNEVMRLLDQINWGGTNCALPMIDALNKKIKDIDAFVTYTDNETWSGRIHPSQALNEYRKFSGKNDVRLISVGMTATEYSIVDPEDKYSMDVVGASTDTPSLISNFIAGKI